MCRCIAECILPLKERNPVICSSRKELREHFFFRNQSPKDNAYYYLCMKTKKVNVTEEENRLVITNL